MGSIRISISTGRGSLVRAVAVVLTGSAGAQIVTLLVMLPLARLYTPRDFGLFALVQAVVAVGAAIATLRYDLAIVLPKSNVAALVLHKLATFSNITVSSLLSAGLLLGTALTAKIYDDKGFAFWLATAGIITFVMAQIANIQFWLTRKRAFGVIATNRLATAVLVGGFQVLFAFSVGGYVGLLLGLLLGQLVALVFLVWRTPELRHPQLTTAPRIRDMAKRYRKMPLINGPNALLDAVKHAALSGLIGKISIAGLGQYSIAFKATMAPMSLVSGAISQVLLQRLSTVERGKMLRFVGKSAIAISIVAIPIFGLYYLVVPWLVPFAFGPNWGEAGLIAQALMPWATMLTITAPLSSLFIVIEAQEWALIFAVFYTVVPIVFLVFVDTNFILAMTWLGLMMAALLVCWVLLALLLSYRFDRKSQVAH